MPTDQSMDNRIVLNRPTLATHSFKLGGAGTEPANDTLLRDITIANVGDSIKTYTSGKVKKSLKQKRRERQVAA